MTHFTYKPIGVCSRQIDLEMEDNIVRKVTFTGGCSGNTQGVAALAADMTAEELIARIEGIRCGFKPTSCPDQLAKAVKAYLAEQGAPSN